LSAQDRRCSANNIYPTTAQLEGLYEDGIVQRPAMAYVEDDELQTALFEVPNSGGIRGETPT
jgi:hypothetical protein